MSQNDGREVASTEVIATTSIDEQAGTAEPAAVECQSPPAAPMPERTEVDPRARLLELAATLTRSKNRRLVIEYLRLRRAVA